MKPNAIPPVKPPAPPPLPPHTRPGRLGPPLLGGYFGCAIMFLAGAIALLLNYLIRWLLMR